MEKSRAMKTQRININNILYLFIHSLNRKSTYCFTNITWFNLESPTAKARKFKFLPFRHKNICISECPHHFASNMLSRALQLKLYSNCRWGKDAQYICRFLGGKLKRCIAFDSVKTLHNNHSARICRWDFAHWDPNVSDDSSDTRKCLKKV